MGEEKDFDVELPKGSFGMLDVVCRCSIEIKFHPRRVRESPEGE